MSEDVGTPPRERCVTSYPVRRSYKPGVVYPPAISTVKDGIDIHCHAHPGQQDARSLARYASECGMRGILFKTLVGEPTPVDAIRKIEADLAEWGAATGVTPIACWAGHILGARGTPITPQEVDRALDSGVNGIWLPVFNHANTLNTVGGMEVWWNPKADPQHHTEPLPWAEAQANGHYLLGDDGTLKPEVKEIVRVMAERDALLFFGHCTHREIFLLAEEVVRYGLKRAVIDHPYSPFIDLSIPQMQQLAAAGITLNFTFDELSPLLGVDPAKMYAAVRAIGPAHVTLSSDAGEPLFPDSVECFRLVRGYMQAFGLSEAELYQVCTVNPARLVGLNLE